MTNNLILMATTMLFNSRQI